MPTNSTKKLLDIKPPNWLQLEMDTFRFKKLIAHYNQIRLRHDKTMLTNSEWLELAHTYRPKFAKGNPMGAITKTKALLKRQEVKIYADSLLAEALNEAGIDIKFVVSKRKNILEKALEEKQLKVANETLDVIEDYMGIKRIVTQTNDEEQVMNDIDYTKIDENITKELPQETTTKKIQTTTTPSLPASS